MAFLSFVLPIYHKKITYGVQKMRSIKYKITPNIPITEIQGRLQQFAVHTTWNSRTNKSILKSLQLELVICNSLSQTIGQIDREPSSQSASLYLIHTSFPFHCATLLGLVTRRSGFTCILASLCHCISHFRLVHLFRVYRCWSLREISQTTMTLFARGEWFESMYLWQKITCEALRKHIV